jgi:hypothetical protein
MNNMINHVRLPVLLSLLGGTGLPSPSLSAIPTRAYTIPLNTERDAKHVKLIVQFVVPIIGSFIP